MSILSVGTRECVPQGRPSFRHSTTTPQASEFTPLPQGGCERLAFLEGLLDSLGDPLCAVDLQDRILYANRAMARMLGFPSQDLAGMGLDQLVGREACRQLRAQQALRWQGLSSSYELLAFNPHGDERVVLVTGSPLWSDDGALKGSVGVMKDITERKAREEAMAERLRMTRTMAAALRTVLTRADVDSALTELLGSLGTLLGARGAVLFQREGVAPFRPTHHWVDPFGGCAQGAPHLPPVEGRRLEWLLEQLDGQGLCHIPSPRDLPMAARHERSLMHRAGLTSALALALSFHGEIQGFVAFGNPARLPDLDEECVGLMRMLGDVVAAALRRGRGEAERNLLITAVEQSDASIVITDALGGILYVNPAFSRVSGWSRQEALGQNPRILKSGRHDEVFYRSMWDTLSKGLVWDGELVNRRKDGSFYHESASISPVRGATGEILRYVAVKRDMSREKELEAHLRLSQTLEALGRMSVGLAHEMNSPAQSLEANLCFIQEALEEILPVALKGLDGQDTGDAPDPERSLPQGSGAQGGESLRALIGDVPVALEQGLESLEAMTRIVAALQGATQQGSLGPRQVGVKELLEQVLAVSRSSWRSVTDPVLELGEELPPLRCHVPDLLRALVNLVENAAQALQLSQADTQNGFVPRMVLRAQVGDGRLHLEVEDNGPGIEEILVARVFEPFFSTREVGQGSGLGLTMARRTVVEQHGGEMGVESRRAKAVGCGSACHWTPGRQGHERARVAQGPLRG